MCRQHPSKRLADSHRLGLERPDGTQDDRACLLDRDQLAGHRLIVAGGRRCYCGSAPTVAVPFIPRALPVAIVRSQLAWLAYGPRSITGTTIVRPR
jgi:hypothetical protein